MMPPISSKRIRNAVLSVTGFEIRFLAATKAMPKTLRDGLAHPIELEYVSIANQKFDEVLNELGREWRLQDRYLGEARAQRKRALKVWRDLCNRENTNSRNEPNYKQ